MKRFNLQTKLMLLTFLIIIVCLTISTLFAVKIISVSIENQMANNVMNIARAVATDPVVISAFYLPHPEEVLQPYAERIRKNSNNIEYITIINMNRERYSHPNPNNIGKKFVGGDEERVLKGETYISKAVGTLGPSLRAFTPIMDGNKQIGAVAVGILTRDINKVQKRIIRSIILVMIIAMTIGAIGSYFLSKNIKNEIFGLEPYQIAKVLQERNSILDAVVEGIIAVDKKGTVTLINNTAKKIIGVEEGRKVIGEEVEKIIPNSRLKVVLNTGVPEYDDEQIINGISIITNRVPIVINGQIEGAIASFRLKTDLAYLGEQLTGYRQIVDTLRAQAHEFMNHMHVIAGLINLKQYDEALKFIYNELGAQQTFAGLVTKSIKDKRVAALLLGKYSHAAEMGIKLYLDEDSELYEEHGSVSSGDLVTILGNLIENAIEALSVSSKKDKIISVYIKERLDYVFIKVYDNGPGIEEQILPHIFDKGFTTKKSGKGIGLFIVKQTIKKRGGNVEVKTGNSNGTIFIVKVPKGVIV
ncbi:two-component system, CitB family, sensor histidine kinase DctS [Caldanaerovirga acetigignens]|uniref:histidine kinase n=1 Tax=Caldanaerovirga acetigignens TaxID=447595 RepID=A0A1M7G0V5_9FIRM|nr:sensor histidine kinase [Caldanaerovirga acetigignens]SHM09921.1 two-component system, CitB family, sensor histidine kinase DctS [Caldanaerovirga acetigignens]